MTLTGKAKELFRQYYDKLPPHTPNHVPYATFMGLNPSFKWGVYQEFADSVGIDMNTDASLEQDSYWYLFYMKDQKFNNLDDICFKTRQEAREAAIKKLDELLNQ